ncbi:MAG: hypothetical protein AAGF66_18665, partial [Cyanobacteria bacterium P01_H01_bin.119]
MNRLILAVLLSVISAISIAGLGVANDGPADEGRYPVVAQLVVRDRTVTITSSPAGYRYAVADESGAVLAAGLTEDQLSEQYPGLLDTLRPAIADENSELMMLAPLERF